MRFYETDEVRAGQRDTTLCGWGLANATPERRLALCPHLIGFMVRGKIAKPPETQKQPHCMRLLSALYQCGLCAFI